VPDNAITSSGRLVQCSACGNKWTQFPIKAQNDKKLKIEEDIKQKEKNLPITKNKKIIKKKSTKKKQINIYSPEYLQNKHGIKIINPSSLNLSSVKRNNSKRNKAIGYGFYNYLISIFIVLLTLFGILHLTKDIIILNYPTIEKNIDYLYETFYNLSLIFTDFISK
jgi:hypothetical protein